MNVKSDIREAVSKAYAAAITKKKGGGCCGGAPDLNTEKATLIGYQDDDLKEVPSEASGSTFGCGNPLAFSGVREGDVVLDLGSGAGLDLLLAAKKVGPSGRAIGVDMTDEMIAAARRNIAASGLNNAEVRKGYIEELPVESESVDWLISNCVINLSPNKEKVFAEAARVLKPGGQLSVSDIVAEELPEWMRASSALYSSCVAGAISETDYVEGLKKAGLEQVEVKERTVYGAKDIEAFVSSGELTVPLEPSCCGGAAVAPGQIEKLAEAVEGKVWSAKFYARKPGRSA